MRAEAGDGRDDLHGFVMAGPLSPSTRQPPPPRAWMKRNAAIAGLLVAGLLVALGIYGLVRAPAAGVAPASPPQSPLSPGFFG